MMCDSKEQLVTYLYDELDAADRRLFETHLASCAECREELAGLRSTRSEMAAWAPPEPDFGFRIVRGAAAPPAAPRFRFRPAWGLAAAAVLVLAAGAAIANVEVRYGADGLVMRTGWARTVAAPPGQAAGNAAAPIIAPVDWKTALDQVDQRLRDLETGSARASQVLQASGARMSDADLLRRFREMVAQSEARQQRELAQNITTLARQVDSQRRVDFALVQQVLQSASRDDVARHNQTQNSLLRLAAQQQQAK